MHHEVMVRVRLGVRHHWCGASPDQHSHRHMIGCDLIGGVEGLRQQEEFNSIRYGPPVLVMVTSLAAAGIANAIPKANAAA